MKRGLILFLISGCATIFYAQSFSPAMQSVVQACEALRVAISSGSMTGMQTANAALKQCQTSEISLCKLIEGEELDLTGHFVFNTVFVDSLIAGHDVYRFAKRYAQIQETHRGTALVVMHNGGVKANGRVTYSFRARFKQEIAVITEPGGMVSLRIHDATHDVWYNDTEDVVRGRSVRKKVFDLTEEISVLELTVMNCSDKDVSFVIISN